MCYVLLATAITDCIYAVHPPATHNPCLAVPPASDPVHLEESSLATEDPMLRWFLSSYAFQIQHPNTAPMQYAVLSL